MALLTRSELEHNRMWHTFMNLFLSTVNLTYFVFEAKKKEQSKTKNAPFQESFSLTPSSVYD